jgi:hypothetical protein
MPVREYQTLALLKQGLAEVIRKRDKKKAINWSKIEALIEDYEAEAEQDAKEALKGDSVSASC